MLPDDNATYRIIRYGGGLYNNLNVLYPGSEATLSDTWSYNRIVHVSGDIYRIVTSATSFAVLGIEADGSGALKTTGTVLNSLHNDYAGDWVFTYIGAPTDIL